MKTDIVDPPSSLSFGEVSIVEPIHPSSPPARRWRVSIPVSIGALLLAALLVAAGLSLHSRADHSLAPLSTTAPSADDNYWYSLGNVDIAGGVTKIYPLQMGRIKSIEVKENEAVKAGEPLFHLEDTVPAIRVREAEADLQGARDKLAIAEAELDKVNKTIAAQKIAIAAARKNVDKARISHDKQKSDWEEGLSGSKETVRVAEITADQAELGVQGEEAKLVLAEAGKSIAEKYVAAARTNIEAKLAQLDKARIAVKECVVRAPVDGAPLRILINIGEVLGSNPRQPAIEFAANRPHLLVRAEVGQEFASCVRKDQSVVIMDHVTGQKCAHGTVTSIAGWYARRRAAGPEMLSLNNDARTLECIIKILPESVSPEVRIGQRVRVQFPG